MIHKQRKEEIISNELKECTFQPNVANNVLKKTIQKKSVSNNNIKLNSNQNYKISNHKVDRFLKINKLRKSIQVPPTFQPQVIFNIKMQKDIRN